MVKRMNEAFSDEDHQAMKQAKERLAEELGYKSLSWEKFLLHVTGVRELETK